MAFCLRDFVSIKDLSACTDQRFQQEGHEEHEDHEEGVWMKKFSKRNEVD